MSGNDPQIISRLEQQFAEQFTSVESIDQPTLVFPKSLALELFRYVKDVEGYVMCLDVCAVDWVSTDPRFEIVYHLYHPAKFSRLRLKTWTAAHESVPSAVSIWPGVNWPEREAYDLFGIHFDGHPQLARIYLPDDWEGHPLRKDYPTGGPRVD